MRSQPWGTNQRTRQSGENSGIKKGQLYLRPILNHVFVFNHLPTTPYLGQLDNAFFLFSPILDPTRSREWCGCITIAVPSWFVSSK